MCTVTFTLCRGTAMLRRTWLLLGLAALGCGSDDDATARIAGRPRDGGGAPVAEAGPLLGDAGGPKPPTDANGGAAPDAAIGPSDGGAVLDAAPGADAAVGGPGPWATGVQVGLVEVAQAVF